MRKKYKAKSHVSLSVALSSGKSTHVTFSPLTGGGSVYYTDNPELQRALEHHPKYGKLFKVDESEPAVAAAAPAKAAPDKPADGVKEMKFACLDDAKDWLVDKYGLSRTKLRSRTAIIEAGKKEGIELVISS